MAERVRYFCAPMGTRAISGGNKIFFFDIHEAKTVTQDEFMKERVDHQIEWYDKSSIRSQYWFKSLRMIEISAAALIACLAGLAWDIGPHVKWAISALGVVILVVSGALSINKFHERWIKYRTSAETLKHHKYLFLTSTEPYDGNDAYDLFVKTVEAHVSKENSLWGNYTK